MPETAPVEAARNKFGGAQPIFPVADLQASIDYFCKALGFKLDWSDEAIFGSVSRDRCALYLCQGDQGHPGTWAWVGVEDVAALAEEFARRGAKIRQGPTNFPWAREIQVEDLDGNVLRFGSDPIPGEPWGAFLDMHGRLWPIPQDRPIVCE